VVEVLENTARVLSAVENVKALVPVSAVENVKALVPVSVVENVRALVLLVVKFTLFIYK
jgi:hypothetical protein